MWLCIGDVQASRTAHEQKSLVSSSAASEGHSILADKLKSIVYGGLDGIITTFAVVSGATGGGFGVEVCAPFAFLVRLSLFLHSATTFPSPSR